MRISRSNASRSPASRAALGLRGEPVRPQRRDVEHARVGDGRREAVLERQRPHDAEAGVLEADDGHPGRVDVGAREHRVGDRRQHRLPVRAQHQPVLEQRGLAAGAVERHPVTAAGVRGGAGVRPRLRRGLASAVVDHHERTTPAAGLEEIARERAALVREREPLAAEQRDRALPARALAAPERGLGDRAVGVGDQRQRRRVVRGGMQVAASARPAVRRGPGRAAGRGPFAQPRVGIAVLHASGGREDLAQVRGSPGGGRQQSPIALLEGVGGEVHASTIAAGGPAFIRSRLLHFAPTYARGTMP